MGSGKLCEQVGRELIGRKVGVGKDERRCEGDFAPKQEHPDSAADSNKKEEKEEKEELMAVDMTGAPENKDDTPQSAQAVGSERFNVQAMSGIYNHGAYGQIEVSIAPRSAPFQDKAARLNDTEIINRKSEQRHMSPGIASPSVIHVAFKGKRTFKTTILLHSAGPTATDLQTVDRTFFTMEKLWAHGSLTSDAVPGLPEGHGKEGDHNYPFKQAPIWESQQILASGACFEHKSDKKKRLGMVLANTESFEAAMRKGDAKDRPLEDWQMKMVWFDRVE